MIGLFDMLCKVNWVSLQDRRQANYKTKDGKFVFNSYGNLTANPEALPYNDETPDTNKTDQH